MVKGGQSRKTKAVGVVSSSHSHISSSFTKKVPTPHSDEEMQSDSDSTQPPTGGSTQHPTSSSTQPPTGDSPQHPTEGSSQPAERRISRRLAKKEVVKDSNGKIIITLSANGLLTPSFEVRACCTDSFQQFVDIEGTTWNNLSKKTTQKYFDELLKYFVWDEKKWSIDIVRKHWNQQARAAYRDFLSGVKKAILKKKKRLIYISKEIEDAWRVYWRKPEVKAKAKQASKNRRSEPEGPGTGMVIHFGGSKSTQVFAEHLAATKNIPIIHAKYETFKHWHKKGDAYSDGRSKRIGEEVERRLAELRAPLPSTTEPREVSLELQDKIYEEVAEWDSKGRLFGTGCMNGVYASGMRIDSAVAPSTEVDKKIEEVQAQL